MHLPATINQQEVIILVDSRSTHNFVNYKLTKRLGLLVTPSNQLKVMIVD